MMITELKNSYEKHLKGDIFSPLPLFFLALIVYLQQAWVPGFFGDGYLYAAFGKNASELGHWLIPHLSRSTYGEFPDHTPFFFIMEGLFFKIIGFGTTQARIFGSLFTLGSVYALYNFVSYSVDRKRAYFATLAFILIYPLIKKTRFPNMDTAVMLTIFLAMTSYYKALIVNKGQQWYCCGFFAGLSLLIKGPIAFLIPLAIFCDLLVSKKINILKSYRPWLGFLLAFLIFSFWPLSLYFAGRADIFLKYLHSTFSHTISESRGLQDYNIHVYILFLLKQTGPWLLALLFVFFGKKDRLTVFSLVSFLSMLIFLSLQKLKYSHYLIPLYPFYAMAIAGLLAKALDSFRYKLTYGFKVIAPVLALVLLIFPLTTKTRRDRPLHHIQEISQGLKVKPNAWAIIDGRYPFFSAANFFAYHNNNEVYQAKSSLISAWLKGEDLSKHLLLDFKHSVNAYRWGFLVPSKSVEIWKKELSSFDNKLLAVAKYPSQGLTLLLPRVYFHQDALLELP